MARSQTAAGGPTPARPDPRAAWRWVYRDPRWKELRDLVLSEEPACRTGCGAPARVVDHIRPHRGDEQLAFDRDNCQGMCKPCHDAKTAREIAFGRGSATPVTVVAGPPCAGKTTWVDAHRGPHDLVVDHDRLAVALGSEASHGHPPALLPFLIEIRDAVLARLRRPSEVERAWVVTTSHRPDLLVPDAEVVWLLVDEDTCLRRARASGRPREWQRLITEWWITHRAHASLDGP